jgi:hypothetical protein
MVFYEGIRFAAKPACFLNHSVRMEIEDDDFVGFVGSRFPLAAAHGVRSCLGEDGMAAEDVGGFDGAVGSNNCFDFHAAGDSHFLGQPRISRDYAVDHLAMSLG